MFSIVIVSWKNLPYLKLLIKSIRRNSFYQDHQLLVHVQESCGATIDWLQSQGIAYTESDENIGLSSAANLVSQKADRDYICLIDDDMYVLPEWDEELIKFIERYGLRKCWVVSTMLERSGEFTVEASFGQNLEEFEEARLLKQKFWYQNLIAPLINNSALPGLIPHELWRQIGGYDEDFPTVGSEIGLAKKLYDTGCRDLAITVPGSLVYHFQARSTGRVSQIENLQAARDQMFLRKYGVEIEDFKDQSLKKGTVWNRAEDHSRMRELARRLKRSLISKK